MADFKEKIATALEQLDHTNDAHWTEEGQPRTSVVQKLAENAAIRRQDIEAAVPGFVRKVSVTASPKAPSGSVEPIVSTGDETSGGPREVSVEEYRVFMHRRVTDAEKALTDNDAEIHRRQANRKPLWAALEKAKNEEKAAFPPITQADNIKQFLASEHEKRRVAAGLVPMDAAYGARRGSANVRFTRPNRAVYDQSGNRIMPQSKVQSRTYRGLAPVKTGT